MSGGPAVLCRPDGLHVAEAPRLWIVTNRVSDYARWLRMVAEDPLAGADWPASVRGDLADAPPGDVADPLDSDQPMLPADPRQLFVAGLDRRDNTLVAGITVTAVTGVSEIGGVVHRDRRGQGLGREALEAACGLLHGHFGVARLTAGCEEDNTASRRWLAGAGFTPAAGAPTYRLATGRVTRPLWWERVDRQAERLCRRHSR
jgi:RimJ/RimL family protein N-acetyltransferase